ncbi:hypothetical protein WSM22_33540 [Cytophagales bacterium WSM2-2]|nr:hypothetical protein WSM22_33540 [Cytophagales bacterium WSM2-2]
MAQASEFNFVTTLLPLALAVFVIAAGVILLNQHFRKNLYRQLLEKEELKSRHQNDLLRSSIDVQEHERKRIAQDMHDELGATLSIARMHLMQMERLSPEESAREGLANVRSLTETALATMRRISHELMPPQLETFGLVKTLEDVASQLNKINEIKLAIDASPIEPSLPWNITLGMYRIVMELINNTIKHAHASEIGFSVQLEGDQYLFTYWDNGVGLPGEAIHTGLGRNSIEARINSLHGSFEIDKGRKGFKIVIKIPVSV